MEYLLAYPVIGLVAVIIIVFFIPLGAAPSLKSLVLMGLVWPLTILVIAGAYWNDYRRNMNMRRSDHNED